MAAGLELLCATTDQLISTIKVEYTKVEVAPLYESPAEVLLGFDCDRCCLGYDSTDMCPPPTGENCFKRKTSSLGAAF